MLRRGGRKSAEGVRKSIERGLLGHHTLDLPPAPPTLYRCSSCSHSATQASSPRASSSSETMATRGARLRASAATSPIIRTSLERTSAIWGRMEKGDGHQNKQRASDLACLVDAMCPRSTLPYPKPAPPLFSPALWPPCAHPVPSSQRAARSRPGPALAM